MLLLDAMKPKASESFTQTSGPSSQKPSQPRDKAIRRTANADDSDTEPESDGEPSRKIPTTSRSTSPPSAGVNSGHAPGRIIGSTYPLADFQKNLARGDLVSKAVEDLGWVIREIIGRPFGMGRSEELITCIKALRDTALKVAGWPHRVGNFASL
jgi:ATP-dependent DNA helicase 2 subunit 2